MADSARLPYDWSTVHRSGMHRFLLRSAVSGIGFAAAAGALWMPAVTAKPLSQTTATAPLPVPAQTSGVAPAAIPAAAPASASAAEKPVAKVTALFQALELNQTAFVAVAAPIGSSGEKAQLQIYEQLKANQRPCYQVQGAAPAKVNPLLGTFDFTGICSRYIDSVGYSTRIGSEDLFKTYRLVVRKTNDDTLLFATAGPGQPELLVARTLGTAGPTDFLQFQFEPGWRLMRRAYAGRPLGHVYLYRDGWPEEAAAVSTTVAEPLGSKPQPQLEPQAPPPPAGASVGPASGPTSAPKG